MTEDDARTRILTVATHLFAHRGFGGTSVREVVEAAGVTKPTLYYYFGSKEKLYVEAVGAQLQSLSQLVREAIEGSGTTRERLHRFLQQYVGEALAHRDGLLLALKAGFPTDAHQPTVDVPSLHLELVEPLGRLLAEGIDRGELRDDLDVHDAVLALVGAADLRLLAGLHGAPLPADYAERILETFFRGVARCGGCLSSS